MTLQLTSQVQDLAWAKNIANFARNQKDNDVAEVIDQLIQDYDSRKITLALVGLNKRGKSTLCNAFLGRQDDTLAPIAWQPATSIISTFANHNAIPEADQGQDDEGRTRAFVNFENHTRQEIPCEAIRDYALEERNPENRKNVSSLEIYGDFALDKEVVLQDLPGDDSLCAYHTQVVYRYLPNADVILFLSSATDPIQQSELALLRKVAEHERRKIFFVINKADECDGNELEEARLHNQKVLLNAGISYENRIFCISAKQVMEQGHDDFEFEKLSQEIQDFVAANKLNLLRDGFRNAVSLVVADLTAQMKLRIEANRMSAEELQTTIEKLQEAKKHCQEILKHELDRFLQNWKAMLDEFEGKLPELEKNTQAKAKAYIENIPMMDLNKKTVNKIPPKITEIIEGEFQDALVVLDARVRKNLSDLDQEMKAIDTYLAENSIDLSYKNNNSSHTGSLITGTAFVGIGGFMSGFAASIPALLTEIPLVGGILAAGAGVVTAPLMIAAAPILAGGTFLLALPIFSFVRSKKHAKANLLQDTEKEIKKAFAEISTTKLELLRNRGERLYTELQRDFQQKMKQCQMQLDQALAQKRLAQPQSNGHLMLEEYYDRLTEMLEAN